MEAKNYYWLVFFLIEKSEKNISLPEEEKSLGIIGDFAPDDAEIYNSFYLRLIEALGKYYTIPYNWKEKITLKQIICADGGVQNKELSEEMRRALESRLSF